jgi:hypothetical protein
MCSMSWVRHGHALASLALATAHLATTHLASVPNACSSPPPPPHPLCPAAKGAKGKKVDPKAKGGKPAGGKEAVEDAPAGDGDLTSVRQRAVVPAGTHLYVQAPPGVGCSVVVAVVRDPASLDAAASAPTDGYAVVAVRKDTTWGYFTNPTAGSEGDGDAGKWSSVRWGCG